ncbi:MAG TPA: hypothetical protein VGN34_22770 [Ktedonobacteraceae bacterium]
MKDKREPSWREMANEERRQAANPLEEREQVGTVLHACPVAAANPLEAT